MASKVKDAVVWYQKKVRCCTSIPFYAGSVSAFYRRFTIVVGAWLYLSLYICSIMMLASCWIVQVGVSIIIAVCSAD